jgi:hypothetical protein
MVYISFKPTFYRLFLIFYNSPILDATLLETLMLSIPLSSLEEVFNNFDRAGSASSYYYYDYDYKVISLLILS